MAKRLTATIIFIIFIGMLCHAQYVWRHKACLPAAPRGVIASFALGNKAYVVGGAIGGSPFLDEVWEYNSVTDTWTRKNNFPRVVGGASAFVINDTAYICLGWAPGTGYSNACYRYEQSTDSWTPRANFPGTPRWTAMCFVLKGKAYVGCGKDGGVTRDFYEYNPATNNWASIASMPGTARQAGYGAAVGGFGYIGFGADLTNMLKDSWRYNVDSNSWSYMGAYPGPARDNPGFFVINDTLYIAAGYDYLVRGFSDCWRYEAASNTWTEQLGFGCIAPPRFAAPGFTINGRGYILCGTKHDFTQNYNDLLEFGPLDTSFAVYSSRLGPDTGYCGNFSKLLSTGDSCTVWSTGEIGPQITVTTTGVYTAYFPDSCGLLVDSVVIGNQVALQHSIAAQPETCNKGNGSAVVIINTGAGQYTYSWNTGDSTAAISNLPAGIYTVTVTSTSGCGSATATAIVNATGGITLSDSIIHSSCGNSNGAITVTPQNGTIPFTYNWSHGDSTAKVTSLAAGSYSVTVSDAVTCSATAVFSILPSAPGVDSIVAAKKIICPGDSVYMCSSTANAKYFWNTTDTTRCIYAKLGGNYYVTVTDAGSCTASANASLNVYPLPPVSITVNGDTLTGYDAITYQWFFNGIPINGATGSIHIARQSGDYTLAITDSNGCSAVSTAKSIVVGIANIDGYNIKVYPNPVTGNMLHFTFSEPQTGATISIFDVNGRKVAEQKATISANIPFNFLAGLYFYEVKDVNGGLIARGKLIAE